MLLDYPQNIGGNKKENSYNSVDFFNFFLHNYSVSPSNNDRKKKGGSIKLTEAKIKNSIEILDASLLVTRNVKREEEEE